jgi:heme oxygenase
VPRTAPQGPVEDLRLHLRAATMAAHDLLDHTMQAASGWQNRDDYARFLALQHAARAPIEAWLEHHAPADLQPPRQTPLIAADLATLKTAVPPAAAAFALPDDAAQTSGGALGAAWVLAGSALGNKAILKLRFWHGLRARLERPAAPAEGAAAAAAARAIFAHFLAHAERALVPAQP